ncbi:MAG: class I SAM-dependent methyltransferase [Polyangiales bacterium]
MESAVTACRICGSTELEDVLSLGMMPQVNRFLPNLEAAETEPRHPLAIRHCVACTHVQLTHALDPAEIFTDYIYFSSMSETIVRHGEALAARYAKELSLGAKDLVAELASNDGCILKPFKAHCRIQGVEPARNVAEVAVQSGVPTHVGFFDGPTGRELREAMGPARLIIARNVVAHVPAVVDFIAGAGHWLADDGILHVEVPYLREMLDKLEFDTIYHEHLSYFSVTALDRLFAEAGLVLWDVEELGLHGGSLIARGKRKGATPTANVARFLAEERATDPRVRLRAFAEGTKRLKDRIPAFLAELRTDGKVVGGYGAAAKGVVLANYCGIGRDVLPWVADRSPHKLGKLMPGVHLPVVPPQQVIDERPDYLLVLAWNFVDEIEHQLEAYAAKGGRFVVPVPEPRVREPRS